jgi:ribosome hibernation promoting factor
MTLVPTRPQEDDAMHLDIRGRNLRLTPALLDHVDRRLRFALGRFTARLSRVAVRVGDVNGPRGGVDKRCWIHLELGGKVLTIEEVDADLYVAIDRASERAGRATERALARLRAA